jgi:hypothetical protein
VYIGILVVTGMAGLGGRTVKHLKYLGFVCIWFVSKRSALHKYMRCFTVHEDMECMGTLEGAQCTGIKKCIIVTVKFLGDEGDLRQGVWDAWEGKQHEGLAMVVGHVFSMVNIVP